MELELRIALLLIGLAAIVVLYFFGKSRRATLKREDDEFNFETSDLPDPLELDQALELGDDLKKKINLQKSIPVYLLYWTSWVTRRGVVHFRDDIYERDASLIREFEQS